MAGLRFVTLQDLFYLHSAVELAQLCQKIPSDSKTNPHPQRACVVGAVTCAASFLECSINGLYSDAKKPIRRTRFHKALTDVWDDKFERLPMFSKYQVALALARAESFRRDREPFQSADALVRLRNNIAHPKELMTSEDGQVDLRHRLSGKFEFNSAGQYPVDFFPDICLSTDCAMWAVESAAKFFLEFERRLPRTAYFLSSQAKIGALLSRVTASRRRAPLEMPRPL